MEYITRAHQNSSENPSEFNVDSFISQRCSIYTEIVIIIIIPANSHTFQILKKKKTTIDAMSRARQTRKQRQQLQ